MLEKRVCIYGTPGVHNNFPLLLTRKFMDTILICGTIMTWLTLILLLVEKKWWFMCNWLSCAVLTNSSWASCDLYNSNNHSCQNVNRFLIFLYCISYRIVYRKIHKYLIKFIKIYRYTYVNSIFIINFKHIQLITNLFIIYVIIFNKLTK